jgi:tetratricopeptide (TPR) repeat protein
MPNVKALISHAHDEKAYADAWKTLLSTVSLGCIEVWFSSDVAPSGGMEIGKEWREQLYQRLGESDFIIAIQTPTSAGRPWIMWECGAASGINKERGLIPVVFGMGRGDLANPLTSYQVYQGEERNQVLEICSRLLQTAQLQINEALFDIALTPYLSAVKLHPPRKPIRAEQLTLWRTRFEELISSGRYGEILAKRQAMYATLPRPFNPVEPTVHELLSRVLLDHRHYDEAIQEVDYALSLLGDDIDLLHRKALALAEKKDLSQAESIVAKIFQEHPELRHNSELASLEGRINRDRWEIDKEETYLHQAFDAYLRAYRADQTQYYPGINAGSLALAKKDVDTANTIFADVLQTCDALRQRQEVSYWVDFTVGDVLLGMGRVQEAIDSYRQGLARQPQPPPRDKASALRGALRMAGYKGLGNDVTQELNIVLKP